MDGRWRIKSAMTGLVNELLFGYFVMGNTHYFKKANKLIMTNLFPGAYSPTPVIPIPFRLLLSWRATSRHLPALKPTSVDRRSRVKRGMTEVGTINVKDLETQNFSR